MILGLAHSQKDWEGCSDVAVCACGILGLGEGKGNSRQMHSHCDATL